MNAGFNIYLLFIISWFLHLAYRIPALGVVRFDLLLVVILTTTIFFNKENSETTATIKLFPTHKMIKILVVYIALTLPFVQWPGSVIFNGAENFIKAIVFYYFTIYFVNSEEKLKKFITVFIACQSFRIIEPLYLHITQGYWGSFASMQGWEYMDRLSGAPSDIVNPNGLAFIVLTVIPFYYYLLNTSILKKLLLIILMPLSIYVLLLTGSRSGVIGLCIIFSGIFIKSKNKPLILLIICIGTVVSIALMGNNFKDRYASIVESDTKNSVTAEGRMEGVKGDFMVALKRPLFGFGLGTSREANANFRGVDQLSHNLYTEVAQELGFVGLAIFILLIKSIISSSREIIETIKNEMKEDYFSSVNSALLLWLYMNLIFSFASYGLSSYEWYLFAGMSISLKSIINNRINNKVMLTC